MKMSTRRTYKVIWYLDDTRMSHSFCLLLMEGIVMLSCETFWMQIFFVLSTALAMAKKILVRPRTIDSNYAMKLNRGIMAITIDVGFMHY